ncbi:DUF6607 family protein [Litchfieldella rifensis]|uniref:DUF6607 family protein n=1 Tax=Litchfieldella rifensis TaxID=762643 RepID=A0ABV7LQ38_9GAMM
MTRTRILLFVLLGLLWLSSAAHGEDERRFVFSYQYTPGDDMAPRGGTLEGPPVTLAEEPTEDWRALQENGLEDFERDRRAILAMAGEYRTSFDFLEIAGFVEDFEPDRPYQSWATEYIEVLKDTGDFISLQHVLVIRPVDEEGATLEPIVTKHWRQDWQYEDDAILAYRGRNVWERESIPADQREGSWSQAVYHVDDSPRYASYGHWRHHAGVSTWQGSETWRPLPRREFSVRDDYQVLVGRNEHTITPRGWIHRQENLKTVLQDDGSVKRHLALEYGVNRYQRIEGFDFSLADAYLERTDAFWRAVRHTWSDVARQHTCFRLKPEAEGYKLFQRLFDLADASAEAQNAGSNETRAQETIREHVSPLHGECSGSTS